MSLFDSDAFTERLFFPRAESSRPPPGAVDDFVEVGGATLHVRYHAALAARTVLLFHGNGETVADYDDAGPRFAAVGLRLAVVDYRGYGQSTGTPSLRTAIADAHVMLGAVHATAGAPIIVMGRSLGSACAVDLYARNLPIIAGVVIESGFADLGALVRRRGLEAPARFTDADLAAFDPAPKLARGTGPLLVLHGAEDTMISAREAEANFAAAATKAKQLVLVPGHGHNDVSRSPVYWDAIGRFVRSLGKP